MLVSEAIVNLIHREIERANRTVSKSHAGVIDSYDPQNHAVKVKFMTELDDEGNPKISGWIPLGVQSGGANTSWVIGPTPGDQAVVSHLEGDAESGHVTHFLHNDVDRPPVVQSGEVHLKTQSATIHIDQSGNVTINNSGLLNIISNEIIIKSNGSIVLQSGLLTHNGVNVGSTHVHGGVVAGGADTSGPQ